MLLAPLMCWGGSASIPPAQAPQSGAAFQSSVQPFLAKNCFLCHNTKMKTGGLDLQAYTTESSVDQNRDTWETVLKKLKTGEMPPKGLPRPKPADLQVVTNWIQAEFDRQDQLTKPNPGRVTARRLNRAEYNNTVRDLLSVDYHPADYFPQEDLAHRHFRSGNVKALPGAPSAEAREGPEGNASEVQLRSDRAQPAERRSR